MEKFTPRALAAGIWQLTGDSAAYLALGDGGSLIIDTGDGGADAAALALEFSGGRPMTLVNTHWHRDHTGGNRLFPQAFMHSLDIPLAGDTGTKMAPIEEGFVFSLGSRSFETLHMPGHSAGGVCLYDRANRVMFTGDLVSEEPIFMIGPDCSLEAYIASLRRLLEYEKGGVLLLNSHGSVPADFDLARDLIACAGGILGGSITPEAAILPIPKRTEHVWLYRYGRAGIFMPL